jgi:hypothetical protein
MLHEYTSLSPLMGQCVGPHVQLPTCKHCAAGAELPETVHKVALFK